MHDNNRYYDNLSYSYDYISEKRRKYLESIDQEILNFIKPLNINAILDVGIGNGKRSNKFITKLNFSEKKFYGIEPSEKMHLESLKIFNEKKNIININLESYQTHKKFELIMCLWNVIGHVSNLEIFIKKVSELSSHNGYFIFDFNNIYNLKEYGLSSFMSNSFVGLFKHKFKFRVVNNNDDTLVNYYKPKYISKILSFYNFKILKKIHINYKDGTISNFLNGQILLICKHESK